MFKRKATKSKTKSYNLQTRVLRGTYSRLYPFGHDDFFVNDAEVFEDVSWIQMKEKWVENAGFHIGMVLNIEVSERRLIITPA